MTSIMIIQGIPFTIEEIRDLLCLDDKEEWSSQQIIDLFYDRFITDFIREIDHADEEETISFFSFPCCSKSREKVFILGYEISSFYSKGSYPVSKILDSLVKIPDNKICGTCSLDKYVKGKCEKCLGTTRSTFYASFIRSFARRLNIKGTISFYYMLRECPVHSSYSKNIEEIRF